ncbi:MAG: preprotein translocase subunit SecE [Candidatus Atribacteria bacterium]|nr:preprotein translocase subunit SecE [Candidatus Atribacteria bacterium]
MKEKANEKTSTKTNTTTTKTVSKQSSVPQPKRTNRFADFIKGVWVELRYRVKWPTRKEMVQYTTVVLGFVVFWALYIGLWDFLFAKLLTLIVK